MSVLQVDGLRKRFGASTVVDGVSLSAAQGEMVALIGPNGAGKSTCFNLIGGQLRADSGTVVFEGRAIGGWRPARIARAGVGRTFQITAAFASLSVRQNVQIALASAHGALWRVGRRLDACFVDEADGLLALVGLAGLGAGDAGSLAYGDLKRLELALALALRPRLLLMDEPTAGMAPGERGRLMAEVGALALAQGIAVLFTEHDMDVVFGLADRIVVLDHGRVIAEGTPDAIRADARVRAIYLGGGDAGG
jgi:branched-chain amino acid transport system ATP-binding protein